MQEFNKVSTSSNFIKQLLNTTYLPVIRTILPGDFIIEDRLYILGCSIIRCTESGYVEPHKGSTLTPIAKYREEGEYTFGERNGKLCANFQSNSEGYDSKTHEKLGEYLRALRDMYGLNLMPLYNCFSNNLLSNYHVFTDRVVKTSTDYRTKIFKIPIRFNTDYTICIENVGETTFAPAFIRNDNLVRMGKTLSGATTDMTNDYISVHSNDVVSTYSGLRFLDPIKIRFNNIPETFIKRSIVERNDSPNNYIKLNIKDNIEKYLTPVTANTNTDINDDGSLGELGYLKSIYKNLYKLSDDDTYIRIESEDDIEPYFTYFKCSIVPNKEKWREKISVSVDDTSIEGDTYPITEDVYVDFDKDYYVLYTNKLQNEIIYNIKSDEHCNKYDSVEDTLHLLIQVPVTFDSNIVVLEGDYTNCDSVKIFNESDLETFSDAMLDNLFISNLKLLRMNTKTITPYSDTLMQFLLWHAICSLDTINLDMDRLLRALSELNVTVNQKTYANYWYYRYRQLINDFVKDNGVQYIEDNLGYVTSEIESFITGYKYDY